jgi:hypothetical protein
VVQGRRQVWGTPKSYEQREVPIPRFLINDLAEHVRDKSRDDLVFTGVRSGTALRAASLAIASGANVKSRPADARAQVRDRHLDQYGHLFGDDLDTIADRLDVQARTARTSCGLFADCGRVDQAAVGRSGSYSPVEYGPFSVVPRQDSKLSTRYDLDTPEHGVAVSASPDHVEGKCLCRCYERIRAPT